MARNKVKNENLKELAEIYNLKGKQAVYEMLKTTYGVKNPYFVFRRMCDQPDLAYDQENDCFQMDKTQSTGKVFLSMEELCSPIIPQHIGKKEKQELDNRSAAMDELIRELIGDRLLELSKYVTIDSLSKRIIIDKTTLITDGYQLITH